MKKYLFIPRVLIISVVLAAVAIAAAPPGAPTVNDPDAWKGLTPQSIEKVKKGEIVVGGEGGPNQQKSSQAFIRAAFIVNVSIQEAWRILRETEKQYEYVASSDENKLIVRTKDYDIVEFVSRYVGWEFRYRIKHQWNNEKFQMWWALDPTFKNDVKRIEGYWHLFYIDDTHTLIRYGTILVSKDIVPKIVQDTITKRDLPNGLEDVRKRLTSHGAYKKKKK